MWKSLWQHKWPMFMLLALVSLLVSFAIAHAEDVKSFHVLFTGSVTGRLVPSG
jgi:hypothetical protein